MVVLGMLADGTAHMTAVPLLLIYNLVFVLPMVVIVALAFRGLKLEKVQEQVLKRKAPLHLIQGLVMLALGLMILARIV